MSTDPASPEALQREIERLRELTTRQEHLLDALINRSPMGVIVYDVQGVEVLKNPAAERIWSGPQRAFHRDSRPYAKGDWSTAQCLNDGVATVLQDLRIQQGGEMGWLLEASLPLLNATGRVEGALWVFADITEIKRTQSATPLGEEASLSAELAHAAAMARENAQLFEAEKQARAAAELASRMREDLLAVVSHDLKNPLSSIVMSTALLKTMTASGELPERVRKHTDNISTAATSMNRLIGDLLDLASMESGHFVVSSAPHEVAPLIRDCLGILSPVAAAKSVRLECPSEGRGLWAYCDVPRVSQILGNLIGNAIKFTPSGGNIRVEAEAIGAEVRFSISDTGPGIPDEHVKHVFDRYWRARKERRTGVGLGLSIAKGLAEAHGGRIWVESRVGKGTTFFFTLRSTHATTTPVVTTDDTSSPNKHRLLVVDDDRELRESLCEFLEEAGYDVDSAKNGADALEHLTAGTPPDLILLDLVMPGMNGWQFHQAQKQTPALAAIPLIVMTSNRDVKELPSGPDAVVYKPLRLDQLLATIERNCKIRLKP